MSYDFDVNKNYSAVELYPAYSEALAPFKALTSDWETAESQKIIRDFENIATLYSATLFGYEKVLNLRDEIYDTDSKTLPQDDVLEMLKASATLPRMVAINNAINDGGLIRLATELREKAKKVHKPIIEDAPVEISKAFERENLSLADFFESIQIYQALGAEIPAIDGAIFWQLQSSQGNYETYREETIGYYGSKKAAHLALYDFIVKESAKAKSETPWGILEHVDNPADWDRARFAWFEEAYFSEVLEWYIGEEHMGEMLRFQLIKCVVSTKPEEIVEPKGLMGVNLEQND